jgi:hypothetical protein
MMVAAAAHVTTCDRAQYVAHSVALDGLPGDRLFLNDLIRCDIAFSSGGTGLANQLMLMSMHEIL